MKTFFRNSSYLVISNVTRVLEAHLQAPVTPSERHMERNQREIGSLIGGFHNLSCSLMAKPGSITPHFIDSRHCSH
jgi:hypothetical protein